MAESPWRIELFGGLAARCGERVVTHFETRKIAALLACLALRLRQPVPRVVLAEQLWPEEDWDATRNRLRQALSSLRRDLEQARAAAGPVEADAPGGVLLADRADVCLNAAAVTTDVLEFERALRSAGQATGPAERVAFLCEAIALYRGELLPGYYEEWVSAERERLAADYQDALGQLAEALAATGDLPGAITIGRRFVTEDPLREDARCALMRLYAVAGRTAEALREYRDLEQLLRQELRAAPSPATRALFDELRGDDHPSAGAGGQESRGAGVQGCEGAEGQRGRGARDRSPAHPCSPAPLLPCSPAPLLSCSPAPALEPEGGAVPLGSPFYVERATDAQFHAAIERRDSIVLVKGPRQIGKTSLLARGLQRARDAGARIVLTDLQKLAPEQLESAAALFRALAELIGDQLDLDVALDDHWNPLRGWNVNFERFLRREVLGKLRNGAGLVWALDEVDRLFSYPFSNVVFGLFRSWHNERSLGPEGPWGRLTLAIAYATEAHLFITDLNQSPFNVGTRLTLEDFTLEQVEDLNRRYGSPLATAADVESYCQLVGGHPYLVRRGLHALAENGLDGSTLDGPAAREERIFGDHLRRMLAALTQDAELCAAVRAVLQGSPCPTAPGFYRLQSAGVLVGGSPADARPRCRLYRDYLREHLG